MANFAEKNTAGIMELVEQGATISDIADHYGVSYGTVAAALKQMGLRARRSNKRGSGATESKISKEELMRLYIDEDMTVGEIAKMKGTSRQTVYNTLDRYGIPQHKKSRLHRMFNEEKVRELLDSGITTTEAAKLLDVSAPALRKYAKDKNIMTRNERYASKFTEGNLRKWYLDEGKSMTEIANMVGCNYNTVSHACKRYGIRKTRTEIHESMKATMRERYGVDYAMESPEIQKKMRYSRSPEFAEKMDECAQVAPGMLDNGATIADVADALDCSYRKTRKMLIDLGLFTPKSNGR